MKINQLIYFSSTIGQRSINTLNKNFIERSLFLSHTLLIVLFTTYFSLQMRTEKVALLSFAPKQSPLLSALDSDTAVFFLTQKSPYLLHVFFDIYSVTKSICPFSTPPCTRVHWVLESIPTVSGQDGVTSWTSCHFITGLM